MKSVRRATSTLNLPTLKLEGGLFLPDMLEKAALGQARLQTEADYGIPKGLKLKDEYSRAFQIACAQWRSFAPLLERTDYDAQHATATFVTELLRDAFGYTAVGACTGITLGDRSYPITHLASSPLHPERALPIVVAPHNLGLDDADTRFAIQGSGSRKKTAFQLAQELLNASPDHQWAIVTNGKTLRLLRDAATLTRPSYLDIDLQDLLSGQRFAEFAYAWRLLHASRAGLVGGTADAPAPVVWEAWREAGQEEGTRVRDGLRLGVTEALITLGQGFVQHPANDALRQALQEGSLTKEAYFAQLLRLIYRFIFIFSVEERGLVPNAPQNDDDPAIARAKLAASQAYAQGYALARLRDLALRRRARTRFDDLWQGVKIVFKGMALGEPRLGLPALGGLFAPGQCPALDGAQLTNADLLAAMQSLRWARQSGASLAPIDYSNMGTEELGSVYESLLELVPEVDLHARSFGFVGLTSGGTSSGSVAGNDRKLTGSYYTPDSLVQELIKSALNPVIEQRLAANPASPVDALLAIRVIDPACGSGHFLLAAARRLAERLASLRSPDGAVTPLAYRHALREVIARCIFGVDRNPMAVELARTALWLEGFEEGRPLGFLDHHLQVGDALLGLTDLKTLELGIAKNAFKPLSGDDKDVCKQLSKTNIAALKNLAKKRNASAFGQLDVASAVGSGLSQLQALEALPDNTTQQVADKEVAYCTFLEQAKTSRLAHAADLLMGAYLLPKREGAEASIPTSATLYLTLQDVPLPTAQRGALAAAQAACAGARVLHWPLAFPQVFASGGFDCVLGNPPWERIKLQEEEFFATRHRDVEQAKNKAERSQRIQWLSEGMLAKHLFPQLEHAPLVCEAEQRLYAEFISARRTAEASSAFAHVNGEDGGRYPLTGVGDVNTYALFAETIRQITAPAGRAGFIVPSGLATDNSTKDYFGDLISKKSLDSFFEFENEGFFPGAGQGHMLRFALTTIVGLAQQVEETRYLFQGKKLEQLHDPERVFRLSPEDIKRVNPNTLTCPIFQSRFDAELSKKIYQRVPVLIRESVIEGRGKDAKVTVPEVNPWGISFSRMLDMSNDSHLFKTYRELKHESYQLKGNRLVLDGDVFIPLYEAKMVYIFNHRHSDFSQTDGERSHILPATNLENLKNPSYAPIPFYWVPQKVVTEKLHSQNWKEPWLIGWRDVTDARASARTLNICALPSDGVNHKLQLLLPMKFTHDAHLLLANLSTLICDYFSRQKVGGLSFPYFVMKQLPVLPPERYSEEDKKFIKDRVLPLTYSSEDMRGWASHLGFNGDPFEFDENERASLQAELDAYFAKLYGLSRDELCFILNPDQIKPGYPSETFSVLKRREERRFGEYRTQRLVLREFDRMALADAVGQPYQSLLRPPPGERSQPVYSAIGLIRSEDEARFAGLLWSLLEQAGKLPRLNVSYMVAAIRNGVWPVTGLIAQDAALLTAYNQAHPELRTMGVDRVSQWLQWFEKAGFLRVQQQGSVFELVAQSAHPPELKLDPDMPAVAQALLRMADIGLQQPAGQEVAAEVDLLWKAA
jgi:N-6 DNA Methylase